MTYSITLLDRLGDWATVFVSPDRPTEVVHKRAVTNFQHTVEWQQHAKATHAIERLDTLQQKLDYASNSQEAMQVMLCKPLYQEAWLRGYGTLYSAVYRPFSNSVELFYHSSHGSKLFRTLRKVRKLFLYSHFLSDWNIK